MMEGGLIKGSNTVRNQGNEEMMTGYEETGR